MRGRRTWLGGLAIAVACALAIGLALERPGCATGVKETEDAIVVTIRLSRERVEVEQPNGMIDRSIYVPIDQPIRLDVESEIPGAGLLLPELGLRVRAPGQLAIRLDSVGTMPVVVMGLGRPVYIELEAMTRAQWQGPLCDMGAWIYEDPVGAGEQLFRRNGCPQCHALEASELGPSLHGLVGAERELEGGERVVADAAYVETAIVDPQRHIVAGYTRVAMPAFTLATREVDAIRAYLATLE